ncbi:glycosyltransferase [Oceanobacillus neutriphilus]|uniref:Glycosyl transferase n=1 Tax=Oceanobacillus neutriphilus TaxID=531815 RepID=A0ABQ2NZC2_9BACI|nr:glycosyltransferase [Oceanobacillus neutriphilus]GGP14033.1 glycosyl transferase [Oceanobacillus neutriphilus]
MKKNILFVIDSLDIAGAEKSLVSLLSILDYSRFNVDLQLFSYGHILEKLVPKEVNILTPLGYTTFANQTMKHSLKHALSKREFQMLFTRIKYSMAIYKKEYHNTKRAILYWKNASKVIESNHKEYDVAISYAQGVPTYYVAEKVSAEKKLAWVNATYIIDEEDIAFQKKYYASYNKIIAVSKTAEKDLAERFPYYAGKIEVMYDINNPELISFMAGAGNSYQDSFNGIRILTIGRLSAQKGYDIALQVCRMLKEKGIHFKWYVLGKGPLNNEIVDYIKKHNLEEHFILLGVEANPYPFIKHADIYVQTSKFEGFGLAIAEARMLNTPVVTTRFDAVYNQMIHEKNGLIVDMNAESVVEGILRLIHEPDLRKAITHYLKQEKKGNTEEIEKFYQLIG